MCFFGKTENLLWFCFLVIFLATENDLVFPTVFRFGESSTCCEFCRSVQYGWHWNALLWCQWTRSGSGCTEPGVVYKHLYTYEEAQYSQHLVRCCW